MRGTQNAVIVAFWQHDVCVSGGGTFEKFVGEHDGGANARAVDAEPFSQHGDIDVVAEQSDRRFEPFGGVCREQTAGVHDAFGGVEGAERCADDREC